MRKGKNAGYPDYIERHGAGFRAMFALHGKRHWRSGVGRAAVMVSFWLQASGCRTDDLGTWHSVPELNQDTMTWAYNTDIVETDSTSLVWWRRTPRRNVRDTLYFRSLVRDSAWLPTLAAIRVGSVTEEDVRAFLDSTYSPDNPFVDRQASRAGFVTMDPQSALLEMDCKRMRLRILDGDLDFGTVFPTDWEYIRPDTYGRMMAQVICHR